MSPARQLYTLSAFVTFFSAIATAAHTPLQIPFNTSASRGPDGPWNFITLNVGSGPSSNVDFFPMWQDGACLLVTQEACLINPSDCPPPIPNYYDGQSQSAQAPGISNEVQQINTSWFLSGWANVTGTGRWTPTPFNLADGFPDIFSSVTPNLTQMIGSHSYTPISYLSLEKKDDRNQTKTSNGGNATQNSLVSVYQEQMGGTPQVSIHMGSATFNQTGSLWLGGYATNRIIEAAASWDDRLDGVPLTSVSFNAGSQSAWPDNQSPPPNFLSSTLKAFISPQVPHFNLPQQLCEDFASFLPINYDESTNLYLWNTSSPQYKELMSSASYNINFTITDDTKSTSIRVPFALLDLRLTAPIMSTPTAYFPCDPRSDSINLGRPFMQAALIMRSYDPQRLMIAQAPGPSVNGTSSLIQGFDASSPAIVPLENAPRWEDTWAAYLPLNRSSASSSSASSSRSGAAVATPQPTSGLSGGSIAGVVVGTVAAFALVGGALLWLLCHRRKRATALKEHQVGSQRYAAELGDKAPTKGPSYYQAPLEMSGHPLPSYIPPSEMDATGYRGTVHAAQELPDTSLEAANRRLQR